jgi:serine/threonine protein kinase
VKEGNKEACYLAPEIFQSMNAKIDLDEYDKGKADVYSLGLTVLSAAC